MLGARYSEPIMDEVVDKLIEFLKDHKASDLMGLVAAAIAITKEPEEQECKKDKKDILLYPLVALNSWTCRYCFAKVAQGQKVCSCCGYGIRWD